MPPMRNRIANTLLTVATILTGLAALYWRDRSYWYSQDEVDSWIVRAKIDLADLDEDLSPNGEARMLVARHDTPVDPRAPYYVHVIVAGPSPAGRFRPTYEHALWAPSHRSAIEHANDVADELIVEMNVALYGDIEDDLEDDDLDFEGPDF